MPTIHPSNKTQPPTILKPIDETQLPSLYPTQNNSKINIFSTTTNSQTIISDTHNNYMLYLIGMVPVGIILLLIICCIYHMYKSHKVKETNNIHKNEYSIVQSPISTTIFMTEISPSTPMYAE